MSHADLIAEGGLPTLFDHFGDAVTVKYKPEGGTATALTAILGTQVVENVYGDGKQQGGLKRVTRWPITISDAPAGLFGGADAKPNATLEIAGVDWAIEKLSHQDGMWQLVVVLEESGEITRPGYYEDRY